jgi:ankyrin repeat protein
MKSTNDRNTDEKSQELLFATGTSNLETMQQLISDGADVNFQDTHGNTILKTAMYNNNLKGAEILIAAGADVNLKSAVQSKIPSHFSLKLVPFKTAETFFNESADMKSKGLSILMDAASGGRIKSPLNFIFRGNEAPYAFGLNGILPNAITTFQEVMPLQLAVQFGRIDIVGLLIDRGADITAKDSIGLSILMKAASGGNLDLVKLLVDKGADINEVHSTFGVTALQEGARAGYNQIVEFLIAKGAAVEHVDLFGLGVLSHAYLGPLDFDVSKCRTFTISEDTLEEAGGKPNHAKVVKTLKNAGASEGLISNFGVSDVEIAASVESHISSFISMQEFLSSQNPNCVQDFLKKDVFTKYDVTSEEMQDLEIAETQEWQTEERGDQISFAGAIQDVVEMEG